MLSPLSSPGRASLATTHADFADTGAGGRCHSQSLICAAHDRGSVHLTPGPGSGDALLVYSA